jgi:hypothetical protein
MAANLVKHHAVNEFSTPSTISTTPNYHTQINDNTIKLNSKWLKGPCENVQNMEHKYNAG